MTWITQASAARLLGKSPQWVKYHVKQGDLKAIKTMTSVLLDKDEVLAFKAVDKKVTHGKRKKNP